MPLAKGVFGAGCSQKLYNRKRMEMRYHPIRAKPLTPISTRRKLALALSSAVLGLALGLLAKYLDGMPFLGSIGTSLGVWVFLATLLAAWSRTPGAAALHVFLFFAAMLVAYYTYSMVLFGFFPRYYFFAWGSIALLSPAAAYLAWYARGDGWVAAVCAALPVGLLMAEGYRFYYTLDPSQIFDVLAAVALALALGSKWSQRARILALAVFAFLVFRQAHVLELIFGDL